MAALVNTTEQKYQQAVTYYTQSGMLNCLKRQWKFLKEPAQNDVVNIIYISSLTAISTCTLAGAAIGKYVADSLSLKDDKKTICIFGGGGSGFVVGVGLTFAGQALMIEHTARLEKWKKVNKNQVIEKLMKEEFEEDPIWGQFECLISNMPMFYPTRTPTGALCDYSELMKCADANGMIKDIYNKTVADPDSTDSVAQKPLYYPIGACLRDKEVMLVIYKRFRHLAAVKSHEEGIGASTRQLFLDYKNCLAELISPLYLELQDEISEKRSKAQSKEGISEQESNMFEDQYETEMKAFKHIFGKTPLTDIDWDNNDPNWRETLNKRWKDQHPPQ